jgi:molybdopterin-dependent oxidoreductase alpha subunit
MRFKVPSVVRSLFFGSKIADEYVQPHIGGDIAFLSGVAKRIIELGAVDEEFVTERAEDWEAYRASIEAMPWPLIEERSGVHKQAIDRVAAIYAQAGNAVFAWAMGITHHEHGVQNVQAIANLAMARGMLGHRHRGLLPLRGHSNVQGIGSMAVTPRVKDSVFTALETEFAVSLPKTPGLDTMASVMAAADGDVRFALCLGGNLFGSNPDAEFAARAMGAIDLVVYMSTTLNTGHVQGRGRETIILPVLARDEEPQATTQESMFNYVRLSDGGPPRHQGPRAEVAVIADIGKMVTGDRILDWDSMRRYGRIREAISKVIPGYEPIADIDQTKKEFQIGGRTFHEGSFPTPSGKARFNPVQIPPLAGADGQLRLMTVRSEGQFNTVVYEDHDLYRGQDRRDVIMLSPTDMTRLGLTQEQRVTVTSATGTMSGMLVRPIDIRPGNAVMYYPEANVLVGRGVDPQSRTPGFKSTLITVTPVSSERPSSLQPVGERGGHLG